MNNEDYYFFWIYNATAQKHGDIGSISVGNYAVNKYTADVRVWQVSHEVSYGDDGALVTTNDLERLQDELRKKRGINSASIEQYRPAHLAKRIISREQAQSAVRLPIIQRSSNTRQLTCWKDSDHLISKLGRSPIISSSPGYRAYAEVDAIAFKPKYQETYTGPLCENRVKLFLAKPAESSFRIVLDSNSPKGDCITIEGTDSCEVKGIRLVDWSKNGRLRSRTLCFGYTKAMRSSCGRRSSTTQQRTSLSGQMSTISLTSITRPTLLRRTVNTNSRLKAFHPTAISFFPPLERPLLLITIKRFVSTKRNRFNSR